MKVYVVMRVSRRSFMGTYIVGIWRDQDRAIREAKLSEEKRKVTDPANDTMTVIRPERVR